MEYQEFFERFGASVRTKNLSRGPLDEEANRLGKPVVSLPGRSGLPTEFIRLCPWEMEFLYLVARRAKVGILEIGRYRGGSTFLLACANGAVPIHSVDLAPRDDRLLRSLLAEFGVGANVNLIVGDSRSRRDGVGALDLLFIDGDHSYEGCAADIRAWYDALRPGGLMAFHDSYPAPGYGVQEAILDFVEERRGEVEIWVSPLIGPTYWRYPRGSMACLRKRLAETRPVEPAGGLP